MNHYELLQVSRDAEPEVLEAAYKALLKKHHPDRGHTRGVTAQKLGEAYMTLSDSRTRRRYDEELDKGTNIKGKRLGEYIVDEFLAEGGFGKTYKGHHQLTGGLVCIKHCAHLSPDMAEILINEARAMENFRHFAVPGMRTITKLEDGSYALVMDFIPGPTLEQLVDEHVGKRKRFDPEHAAWILARLVNGLSYIHRHGVVHGDLKPQNVIIQPDSHMAVIVDFGLAAIKPNASTSNRGYTDVFAPPEQRVPGNPIIPQTDFYALGKTILFALADGDLNRTEKLMIPSDVPAPMKEFIQCLVRTNVLDRPDWEKEDLNVTVEKMREAAFGRVSSLGKKMTL